MNITSENIFRKIIASIDMKLDDISISEKFIVALEATINTLTHIYSESYVYTEYKDVTLHDDCIEYKNSEDGESIIMNPLVMARMPMSYTFNRVTVFTFDNAALYILVKYDDDTTIVTFVSSVNETGDMIRYSKNTDDVVQREITIPFLGGLKKL